MRGVASLLWLLSSVALSNVGCYEAHVRPGEGSSPDPVADYFDSDNQPRIRARVSEAPPGRPVFERPDLPPVQCTVEPAPDCASSFPRVMIIMDGSSSMLAGRRLGANNWDKARFALAGNPDALDPSDPGFVQPAFERELEVRGNLITMEDVFHLGLLAYNAAETQQLLLQYAPCASDNVRWAMDPYVSCEPPGCIDPYLGMPTWTFKNSDVDRQPPFVQTTMSFMPPCNFDDNASCVGTTWNTYTREGVEFAQRNIAAYRRDPGGFELADHTRFANILITDGATAEGSEPEGVLQEMSDAGIPTYVIGLEPEDRLAPSRDVLEQLDIYARAGGTHLATLIEANEVDIAEAFAATVTRIIDEVGTDPCCQPNDCSVDPEPPAP